MDPGYIVWWGVKYEELPDEPCAEEMGRQMVVAFGYEPESEGESLRVDLADGEIRSGYPLDALDVGPIYNAEYNTVGFGVALLEYDWDYGTKSWVGVVNNVSRLEPIAKSALGKVFSKAGFDEALLAKARLWVSCKGR